MKRISIILAVLAAAVVLAVFSAREGDYTGDALAYLERQKPGPVELRSDRVMGRDGESRVTGLEANSDYIIDLLCSVVENAVQVQRVESIPELSWPCVTCGERFRGSYEKLYYTYPDSRKIVEFTLNRADSMTLLLNISSLPAYPEVREYFLSEMTDYLQALLPEDGEDQLAAYEDGYPDMFNICTQETLDWYLEYVRNGSIYDYSNELCAIYAMRPRIQVGGEDLCNYECAVFTSPSTGRPIAFYFRQEDCEALREYIEALAGWDGGQDQ